jgi:putative ABC transport system permease protein
VATAVAVLAGALLVGDSVRGSLRDLVFERLGATDHVVVSSGFFREQLAEDLRSHEEFAAQFDGVAPLVIAQGLVTEQLQNRRAGQVLVYGVDDRFWRFHHVEGMNGPEDRAALLSPALARELAAEPGAAILVRVQRPSDIPIESLFGLKDEISRALRLTVRAVVPRESLGEFALQPQQGEVRAVFVPLARLQQDLEIEGRVNALLVSSKSEEDVGGAAALRRIVRANARLDDLGLRVRALEAGRGLSLESDAGLLDDVQAAAAREIAPAAGLQARPVFTYLANALRVGDREIPYSLVSAIDLPGASPQAGVRPPIVLNEWAARDLGAAPGDTVSLEYYVWEDAGRLLTRTAEFQVAGIVPIDSADRDLAPRYPGITDAPTLDEWDPPFPLDLRRVRRIDEDYWTTYRTTPKAFIPFEVGERLWRSRYGSMTSIRLAAGGNQAAEGMQSDVTDRLRAAIDPVAAGLAVQDVRADGLQASRGATDFGEYFVYFSFFLVVSALLLAALFFKLSLEQRAREVGLLRAVGFAPSAVRRIFGAEGLLLSLAGSAAGVVGAIAYAALMMTGLRTWWVDAVGTTALRLHISPASLAAGAIGGVLAAMVCIGVTLRGLSRISDRSLLTGQLGPDALSGPGRARGGLPLMAAIACAAAAAGLMTATATGAVAPTGAFFGAGAALLAACLFVLAYVLRRPHRPAVEGHGWVPIARLGARNTTYRPGRSVLAIAVMASATFMLISVDAFRREAGADPAGRGSGVGGYSLMVESVIPIVHDPNSPEGRRTLGLDEFESVRVEPFRVLPGDDASCLNLYEPRSPRIVAPRDSFLSEGRFAFQSSLAATDAERANPWLLLTREEPDGAVPVIGDANSLTYVLHRKLGEDFDLIRGDRTIRLRIVAALDDSIFQGELLMSQARFLELFPEQEGYRLLVAETPPDRIGAVGRAIEEALADRGGDATPTAERLAQFHKVENAYLSTFQMLGGLGLLLGTVGLGAVLLRNVLERRRELALLRALGYKPAHVVAMVISENVVLLVSGLVTGTICALLAIAPVVWDRGGRLPLASLGLLLCGVLAVGLFVSLAATAAALRAPVLPALRSE